jgi:hypothetical protein
MRLMIITILCFAFASANLTVSWGGPLSELTEPGEVSITGIDAITNAVESQTRHRGRTLNADRSTQPSHRPGQAAPNKELTKVQILSYNVAQEKTVEMKKSSQMELVPSSPDQFVSAEFFPALPGTTWTYLVDGSKTAKVKVLPEVAIVRGVETNITVNTDTGVSICHTSDSGGILIHRELITDVYIQGVGAVDILVTFIPPIRLADGLVAVGQTSYSIGTAQYTILPQRRVFKLNYTASYTLQAHKTVTVPAGTFDALRFAGTFAVSGNFESETFYLSKNRGLIKDEVESNDQKRTKELRFSDWEP